MTSKKRGRSMFDAVQLLESQDAVAAKKRSTNTYGDVARSKAAVSQTKVYASLMECRILLQRSIIQPAVTAITDTTTTTDTTATTTVAVSDEEEEASNGPAVEKCNELLAMLLQARERLVPSVKNVKDSDDDDDDDDVEQETDYLELVQDEDATELEETLQSQYEACRQEWKQVLDRRHKDVRLHAGLTAKAQFRVMDSSFWEQVDATVQHEQLRSRGADAANFSTTVAFDDTKVYQHLLKDFVLASQSGDQEATAQQRLKHNQSSTKKKVDRKASKGRKIRYNEIPKLVNFTFPLSRPNTGSNLNQEEWFRSLFGGAGNKSQQD